MIATFGQTPMSRSIFDRYQQLISGMPGQTPMQAPMPVRRQVPGLVPDLVAPQVTAPLQTAPVPLHRPDQGEGHGLDPNAVVDYLRGTEASQMPGDLGQAVAGVPGDIGDAFTKRFHGLLDDTEAGKNPIGKLVKIGKAIGSLF